MVKEDVYSAEEIARILKVTPQHIYNLSSPKLPEEIRIPSFKVVRRRRYILTEVIDFFKKKSA